MKRCEKLIALLFLTPNEGLSAQHKEELDLSNLKGHYLIKGWRIVYHRYDKQIDIIDIHKLRDESGDKTVAVES